jgi:hypothetical protein
MKGYYFALQNSDVEHLLKFLSMNGNLGVLSSETEKNLINYIQLAIVARENKTLFIVFDKKLGKYAGSTRFYDINLEFKTLLLGFTWYAVFSLNKHCKYLLFAFETLGMERVNFALTIE